MLSALTNGVVVLLTLVHRLYEAYRRYLNPPEVALGVPLLAVADGRPGRQRSPA